MQTKLVRPNKQAVIDAVEKLLKIDPAAAAIVSRELFALEKQRDGCLDALYTRMQQQQPQPIDTTPQ
jgi:hypothetical protein